MLVQQTDRCIRPEALTELCSQQSARMIMDTGRRSLTDRGKDSETLSASAMPSGDDLSPHGEGYEGEKLHEIFLSGETARETDTFSLRFCC